MNNLKMLRFTRHGLMHGLLRYGAMAIVGAVSASATAGDRSDDQQTCAGMGARPGSSSFTGCMLQQQQRRDNKMALFLEEQRLHQELGRPAREKLQEKRERRAREKWQDSHRD